MGFTVDGIASGLDTKNLISKLLELERRPVENLQRKVVSLQAKQTTYASFQAFVTQVKSSAIDLNPTTMDVPSASVSDEAYVTASVNNSALDGSHSMVVHQLARESRIGSQGFTDADSTPIASSAGTFTVQAGASGAQISIAVNGTTTLNDLASAINAEEGEVKASVVNDGTQTNSYVLVLTGTKGGAENSVTVTSNPTTLNFSTNAIDDAVAGENNAGTYTGTLASGGAYTGTTRASYKIEVMAGGAAGEATYRFSTDGGITWDDNEGAGHVTSTVAQAIGSDGVTAAFSDGGTMTAGDVFFIDTSVPVLQTARDAVFSMDGILQTRTSNTVTDALDGVTLNLVQADASKTISIDVNRLNSTVITKVQALVDSYNGLVSNIRAQQNFDTETFQSGSLFGDSTANRIVSMMRTSLFMEATNVDGSLSSLADIGITTNADGTIKLDNAKLTDLLDNRRSEVIEVLGNTHSSSNTLMTMVHRPSEAKAGDYLVNVTTAAEKAKVSSTTAQTAVLTQVENISFKYTQTATEETPTLNNFTVALAIGDGIGDVINKMNSAFATQNAKLVAFKEDGVLKVESTAYGADLSVTMTSDQDGIDGSTRIGTAEVTDAGVDVVGTIAGKSTTGVGERLQVNATGDELNDLSMNYTGTATGNIGTLSLKSGAAKNFNDLVLDLTDGTDSLLKSKDSSLQSSIDAMNKQIERAEERVLRMQTRLQRQFTSLELTMGKLQNQGNFLTNQLGMMQSQTEGIINKK